MIKLIRVQNAIYVRLSLNFVILLNFLLSLDQQHCKFGTSSEVEILESEIDTQEFDPVNEKANSTIIVLQSEIETQEWEDDKGVSKFGTMSSQNPNNHSSNQIISATSDILPGMSNNKNCFLSIFMF